MASHIDYYYTSVSPFAFFGHDSLVKIAQKHGKAINFKPFNLGGVWAVSGAVMPAERPPVRQRYRLIELQRIADFRGFEIKVKPTHFPTNPALADHCTIAIVEAGGDPSGFARGVGESLWIRDLQVADEAILADILAANGHAPESILAAAKSDETAAIRQANTDAAIAADAVGAPAYVYDGEVFWGQDRLDHLDHMIGSGRKAFHAG